MNKDKDNKNFHIPDDYFEGFTDRLLDKISMLDSGQEGSALPKSDGFKVPNGYFENLNDKLNVRISKKNVKVVSLWSNKTFYMVAASVAAILVFVLGVQLTKAEQFTFEELAENDFETYFESHGLGLSTYEIAEVIPVDDLEITDILDIHLNNEIIIDYLDDNIDSYEELNLTDYEY